MIINLSPQSRADEPVYVKKGDTISVNGEVFDFSQVEEGDTLPREAIYSDWFGGDVERTGGQLSVTLFSPCPPNYSPEQAFPIPVTMTGDGIIPLPLPLPESLQEIKEVVNE